MIDVPRTLLGLRNAAKFQPADPQRDCPAVLLRRRALRVSIEQMNGQSYEKHTLRKEENQVAPVDSTECKAVSTF